MSLAKGTLTKFEHIQRVRILYRRSLRGMQDWGVVPLPVWYEEAFKIRKEIEKNRREADPAKIDTMVAELEKWADERSCHTPYIPPDDFGGTSYARNLPITRKILDPYGRPPNPKTDKGHGH